MSFLEFKKLIFLFIFWYLLSGYYDPILLISGVLSSISSVLISRKLIRIEGILIRDRHQVFSLFWNVVCYLPWLIIKSFLSAIYVMKRVWELKLNLSPTVQLIGTNQKTDVGTFVLANSITFTPGTVSIGVSENDNSIKVVALNSSLIVDIKDIDDKVKKIFD